MDQRRLRVLVPVLMYCCGQLVPACAGAQLAPIDHNGFFEYQYRLSRSEDTDSTQLHLLTWRAQGSTYVWQPYLVKLDGTLGLTRSRTADASNGNTNSIVTGSLAANVFARSRFPFRAYFDSRDSRVDGDVFDVDLATRSYGFLQQFSPAGGGRLSVDYRRSDSDELRVDGLRENRSFGSSTWQVNGSKATTRNSFNLLTSIRDLVRDGPMQTENRKLLNLRHRFRTSPRFFIEDTTFFSDERIGYDQAQTNRRFLQFNGNSNWRPQTSKPLLVIGRVLAQGIDSGPSGFESGSRNVLLAASANYQYSRNVTFAGNLSLRDSEMDAGPDDSAVLQRLRATYRSDSIELGRMQYLWGGTAEAGNRRDTNDGEDAVQDVTGVFNHGLSRNAMLKGGRQFQVNIMQTLSASADTSDRREQTVVHGAYLTLNRQSGRMSTYLRLSASDRRSFGDRVDTFQLVNLQASSRMQMNRDRSWNGSVTLQYGNSSADMPEARDMDNSSFTYSVDLRYMERDLFDVQRLNFQSELRLLSSNFRNNNAFDERNDPTTDRNDSVWRNELDYRVGLLEFRLLADLRQTDDRWMSQVYFQVRRYYGVI